ncbi:endonuclease/exonuclease/phosphatase family protein [Streptomyces longisporoflavus]|uniref:endonuclease/exonuclease/phosphatase family protein n=1 Tax=Streptomyces longisporoflavus TaxID=28044 RepID=UPI00167E15E7|nr:endonuclease/exonuclease/phosphatase family protein [Streptomyces longisporoflavus]
MIAGTAAALGVLIGLLAAPAASADTRPAALPSAVNVITWNICGGLTSCPNSDHPQRKLRELVNRKVDGQKLNVIMMQESCGRLHAAALQKMLGSGWAVQHRVAPLLATGKPAPCAADGGRLDGGVTVAVQKMPGSDFVNDRDASAQSDGWNMTYTPARSDTPKLGTQGAACLEDRGNKLLACTTHLANENADPNAAYRRDSVSSLHQQVKEYQDRGYRTIVGGDFNLEPDDSQIKPMYAGNFEADTDDKCNTAVHWTLGCTSPFGHKYDYIFFSDNGWDLKTGDVIRNGSWRYDYGRLSDHFMLQGAVNPV